MADDGAAAGVDPSPPSALLHPAAPRDPPLDSASFTHTPYYCEENVYLLCKELIRAGLADPAGTDLYAVFISNEEKKVPLWYQKASRTDDGFVLWDYHVICIQYVADAIHPLAFSDSIYGRLFRAVHGPVFLRSFASDRSHMKDSMGNWIELPPKYEPIVAEDGNTNNLNEYIAMSNNDLGDLESMVNDVYHNKHGVVANETLLPMFFSRLPE